MIDEMINNILTSPFGGILGIIHIIIVIWALIQIISSSMSLVEKIIWILVVAALPVIGLIIYLAVGRKA